MDRLTVVSGAPLSRVATCRAAECSLGRNRAVRIKGVDRRPGLAVGCEPLCRSRHGARLGRGLCRKMQGRPVNVIGVCCQSSAGKPS